MDRGVVFPRSLEYLMAIAKFGSFTKAAEAVYVSQPTLSQQIKLLEESVGTPLLDRSGKTVQLTSAGEIYIQYVKRAWSELNSGSRAVHEVKDLSRGSLRVGWTPITDYLTCSLLENFYNLYPDITLSTLEMPQSNIETALSESKIDIGIVFSNQLPKITDSANIETTLLFEEPLCLAVGNTHPLAGQIDHVINTYDLAKESLVLLNSEFALRDHIDKYCIENAIMPHIAIETNSLSVIIEMIQLGILSTILPVSIVEKQSGLYPIEIHPALPHKEITMISKKGVYKAPACLAFTKLAANWSYRKSQDMHIQSQPISYNPEALPGKPIIS